MRAGGPYVGLPVERVEDARFLQGRGQYVDDLRCSGLLHAAMYRSSYAHGRIRSIDAAAALAMPGVHAVLTSVDLGEQIPRIPVRIEPHAALTRFEQPVIAHGKVRYVGEPIAVVVADSAAIAEDAVAAIVVDIEALPAVADRAASETGGVLLFEEHGTNHVTTLTGVRGDADTAVRGADYVRRERLRVQRHAAVPLETRGILAEWDAVAGRLRVSGAMKVSFATRRILAQLMNLAEHSVEVIENDAGGGFGARGEFYPEDFLVPFAARRLGRPIKWIEDRREHLLATSPAREVDCEVEIACRRDGVILAIRGHAWADMGAYMRPNAVTAPRNLAQMIGGPYRVPHLHMDVSMVLSNKTPVASYRGPGRFECDFFRERLFDLAAEGLGMDRVEFRRRNLLSEAEMPYPLPKVLPFGTGGETDSGDYGVTFERCLAEIGWAEKSKLQGRLVDGRFHGLGIGCYVEGGGTGPKENVRLVMESDGSISVYVGSSAVGQGIETIFAQIAADALGVPMARIRGVFHGSTTLVREGWGSNASRATVMGGSALLDGARNLKAVIRRAAAAQFGCRPEEVEFADGMHAVSAGGKHRTLAELAAVGFSAEGTFVSNKRTYSYGAHAAHVAIDPQTGHLQLVDYVAVEDVGRIINPMTLHGQVIGAIVQGLGASVLEHLIYDDEAQLLTGTLASYLLPCAEDFPNIRAISLELFPSPNNPLGAKGAGEGGIIPVGGVIANAVASALAPLGVQLLELPLSPPRIWRMIEEAQASRVAGCALNSDGPSEGRGDSGACKKHRIAADGDHSRNKTADVGRNDGVSMLRMTASDGVRIAYCIDDYTDPWTNPPTLVLLHSAMSSARRLYAMVPHFARKYRVVRMDLRGHGSSDISPPDRALTLERLTRDLRELLDHLDVPEAHLLGVSGGGYLAQQLAIHDPARVSSLLLFASRPGFKDSRGADWIPQMERKGLRAFIAETIDERLPRERLSSAQIDWFLDEISRNDQQFVKRFILYMTTQYWMDDLAKIHCPTLIVAPAGDAIGNAAAYTEMQRLILGSELVVYDTANHNICDYLPDRCARDALEFLSRHFAE